MMKKFYLSLAALLTFAFANAQDVVEQAVTQAVAKAVVIPGAGVGAADPTDTLGLDDFGMNAFLYGSPTGYVFGTNDLYDAQFNAHQLNYEFAGGFIVNDDYTVLGAMILFGGKEDVSGNPADLNVRVWSLADNKARSGVSAQQPDVIGPDAVLATEALPFSDVDTVLPTFVDFSSAPWVNADFAISVDIKALYNATADADTVSLIADEDGDADGTTTWTKFGFDIAPGNEPWFLTTGTLQGGLDVNLGVFAIVSESGVGIEEQGFINGVRMTSYPNPALTSDNIRIDYGLESAKDKVELNIYTTTGQLVYTSTEGSKVAGTHAINIPAGLLASGSYVYALQADQSRIAKRMEVLK